MTWNVYWIRTPGFVNVAKTNVPKPAAPVQKAAPPAPQTQTVKGSAVKMPEYNMSPRDKAWAKILDAVDSILQANPQDPRSREQVVAAYLMTPAGKRLYTAYTNGQDPEEMEKLANTTLRDWAWSVMEKMESDEQARNPAVKPMDVIKKLSKSKVYQQLYELYSDPDSKLPAAQAIERIGKRNAGLAYAFPQHFGR